jgi:hypothetical protein
VRFEVDDIENDWLHRHKFDFIFCRYLLGAIKDWPRLMRQTYECVLNALPLRLFPTTATIFPLPTLSLKLLHFSRLRLLLFLRHKLFVVRFLHPPG